MHPILLKLGPLKIHTYGLLIAAAFLCGIHLMARQGKKEGYEGQDIYDLGFYLLLGAILGSRLLYVAINYRRYLERPLQALYIWEGGLVFYGGLLGALSLGAWHLKKKSLPLWPVLDMAAPSVALGQALGRLGCFAAGCCYGKVSEGPLGIIFTDPECLAPPGLRLHPVQLYASLANLGIFLVLLFVQKNKKFTGQVLASYLLLYAMSRFNLEFWRGDDRGFIHLSRLTLSTSQLISLIVFACGAGLLIWRKNKNE